MSMRECQRILISSEKSIKHIEQYDIPCIIDTISIRIVCIESKTYFARDRNESFKKEQSMLLLCFQVFSYPLQKVCVSNA